MEKFDFKFYQWEKATPNQPFLRQPFGHRQTVKKLYPVMKESNDHILSLKISSSREQMQIFCLNEVLPEDSLARVIEELVNATDLIALGFEQRGKARTGRPAFSTPILLKIYLYGYMHRIRSSRKLEHACRTNVELWWLTGQQFPSYKTIADFRKVHPRALELFFEHVVQFLKSLGLYNSSVVAIDGSKFRAQNSKKKNYNLKKVKQHLDYIETQKEYLNQLDQEDLSDKEIKEINDRHDHLDKRKEKYDDLQEQLEQIEDTQISTTDPDARSLPIRMKIVEVAYNVQTATSDHHNLITNYKVTNKKDDDALAPMAKEAKRVLGLTQEEILTALADKGYCKGASLNTCHEDNIDTYVAVPKAATSKLHPDFRKDKFEYDIATDTYICPAGKRLRTTGKLYQKDKNRDYRFRRYTLAYKVCNSCPFKKDCAKSKLKHRHGRSIERGEFEHAVEFNKINISLNRELYKKRQAIVEHPFGTIKRQWGYDYTLLKGKQKVSGEFALIFSSYNLRRAISILGLTGLIIAIKEAIIMILVIWRSIEHDSNNLYYSAVIRHGTSGVMNKKWW